MITTVTLNPSMDRTIELADLSLENVNRAEAVRLDPGGKGVNVSLALAALDVNSHAVGLNFDGGELIESALAAKGVDTDFVKCSGTIRQNMKIFVRSTGRTVEINEQNPTVSVSALDEIKNIIGKIAADGMKKSENRLFVLGGSIPPGAPKDIYKSLAEDIKSADPGAIIIVDCDGEPLIQALAAGPYMIKPNVDELERTFGIRVMSDDDIVKICRKEIIEKYGVSLVLVSKGADGAVAVTGDGFVSHPAMKITAKSAQGAGDAMVAGACLMLNQGMKDAGLILESGICAAAGAVELAGTAFCDVKRYQSLRNEYRKEM